MGLITGLFRRKKVDPNDLNSDMVCLLTFQDFGIPIVPENTNCHNQLQTLQTATSICVDGKIKEENGHQYILATKITGV